MIAVVALGGGLVSAAVVRDAALAGIFFGLGAVAFGGIGLLLRDRGR